MEEMKPLFDELNKLFPVGLSIKQFADLCHDIMTNKLPKLVSTGLGISDDGYIVRSMSVTDDGSFVEVCFSPTSRLQDKYVWYFRV